MAERKDLGTEEPAVDPGVASFVRACDEVLEFHERAGSSEGAAARQVRAKREELLNDSKATPTDPPSGAGAARENRDGRG